MDKEIYDYLSAAVGCRKGDDLERAQLSFRSMSSAQMDEQHGSSGRTRKEILDGYQVERAVWGRVDRWLRDRDPETDREG